MVRGGGAGLARPSVDRWVGRGRGRDRCRDRGIRWLYRGVGMIGWMDRCKDRRVGGYMGAGIG